MTTAEHNISSTSPTATIEYAAAESKTGVGDGAGKAANQEQNMLLVWLNERIAPSLLHDLYVSY